MKCDVYYNLHAKMLSVRSREKDNYGIVVEYTDYIEVYDVSFVVNRAGRNRVRKEKRKNVHAFVRGHTGDQRKPRDWSSEHEGRDLSGFLQRVIYNPYLYNSFVLNKNKKPVSKADLCIVEDKEIWALNPT